MHILITGSNGFIAKNLTFHLREKKEFTLLFHDRHSSLDQLRDSLAKSDFIFHLAGANRPDDAKEFSETNIILTQTICRNLQEMGKATPILFSSSTQATNNNEYGKSKYAAEQVVEAYAKQTGAKCMTLRLPNVFGKWSRPNYNSVVATFCHNISRGLPIRIDDPEAKMTLVYIDEVIGWWLDILGEYCGKPPSSVLPTKFEISVGELAEIIRSIHSSRLALRVGHVGDGFARALYATYISFLPTEMFSYPIPRYTDARGDFAEVVKTPDSGQFSFLTAKPGVTRGVHYHHSKTEKFLVLQGSAQFRFRNIVSQETHIIHTADPHPVIVETIPGWAHDITNIGTNDLIVLIWANEIFDRSRPDTFPHPV